MINIEDELNEVLGVENPQKSTKDSIGQLTRVWINEENSPELLHFQHQLIHDLVQILQIQSEQVSDDSFISIIQRQEMERVKYIIRCYLRTRLQKIEKYSHFIATDPIERNKLSNDELEYCNSFDDLIGRYHKETYLDQLPQHLNSLHETEMSIAV